MFVNRQGIYLLLSHWTSTKSNNSQSVIICHKMKQKANENVYMNKKAFSFGIVNLNEYEKLHIQKCNSEA